MSGVSVLASSRVKRAMGASRAASAGTLESLEPRRLSSVQKYAYMQAARVAERRDKAGYALFHAGDHHGALAEIDLEMIARAHSNAYRGARGVAQRMAERRDRPFHRPERDGELMLAAQRVAHDIGMAVMLLKAGRQPRCSASTTPTRVRGTAGRARSVVSSRYVQRASHFT